MGEWINFDAKINSLGKWIETKLPVRNGKGSNVAQGLVPATLIFIVGSMAIIGVIDSGI